MTTSVIARKTCQPCVPVRSANTIAYLRSLSAVEDGLVHGGHLGHGSGQGAAARRSAGSGATLQHRAAGSFKNAFARLRIPGGSRATALRPGTGRRAIGFSMSL